MKSIKGGTEQPFRLMLDRMIPMRDGVGLSADLYLPNGDGPHGNGSFPMALLRTIYGKQEPRYVAWARAFLDRGYAAVLQDCRGRYDSDGEWVPYVCEIPDGYDTHEWIGEQEWCDGNIGTFGLSYPGFTQSAPATLRSKYLKGLVPIASQQDNYGHHRVNGVIALATSMFFVTILRRSLQTEAVAQLDLNALLRQLPLNTALEELGDNSYYREVLAHEKYDAFWSSYSLRDKYSEVEVPSYFITGWYDSLLHETITVFNGWRANARTSEARDKTKLLIGPWSHQVSPWGKAQLGPNGEFEDRAFGPDAPGDAIAEHLRWYDTRLKGVDTGMDDEPPIKLFVMGANEWRFESEWPLARTQWTDFYLDVNGDLSTEASDNEGAISFDYDPNDPVPSWGGQYQSLDRTGPRDRSEIETRDDVLIFESDVLEEGIEVTGPIRATIFGSSNCLDTDFTAALIDVEPDGKAIILCEGICRARFRNGTDDPQLMNPGEIYEFTIDMWDTSNLFKAGHRIRMEISSSNFPRYDRNLNSGGPIGYEGPEAIKVARNTLHVGGATPSRLVLPVIPAP